MLGKGRWRVRWFGLMTTLLSLLLSACGHPSVVDLKLTAVLPHDASAFTQGLFFHRGKLYESTGLYGESRVRGDINLQNGQAATETVLSEDVFGEGSVILNGTLYVLTWQEGEILKFDPDTLELREVQPYSRDGWGLTTDGKQLIASDGTSSLFFLTEDLETVRCLTVTREGRPVTRLNELEYIDGCIWANVWMSDEILRINPKTGKVIQTIFAREILPASAFDTGDSDAVLNGIAWNEETKKLYLTGKCWPNLYEFDIQRTGFGER